MKYPPFKRRKFHQESFIHSYFVRPAAQEIVALVWKTPITPNQLTVFRVILNVLALVLFTKAEFLTGFILFQIHEIVDHADGMLARMKNIKSEVGATMEVVSDTLFSSVFGFLGLSFAISGFLLEGSPYYFLYFSIITMSYCIGSYFSKLVKKDPAADIHMNHDQEAYIPFFDKTIRKTFMNWIKIAYMWQNQFLLWGGLLYFSLKPHGINSLQLGFIIVCILSQAYWMSSIKHFKARIVASRK